MSGLNYVYEIDCCPDQEARGQALKAAIKEWWPGSTVELRPHPMGLLRVRIIFADQSAADDVAMWLALGSPAFGIRLFARPHDHGS